MPAERITQTEIQKALAYYLATTRGPWLLSGKQEKRVCIRSAGDITKHNQDRMIFYGPEIRYCTTFDREKRYRADVRFVVEAHIDIPRFCVALDQSYLRENALEAENKQLRKELEGAGKGDTHA